MDLLVATRGHLSVILPGDLPGDLPGASSHVIYQVIYQAFYFILSYYIQSSYNLPL